MKYLVTVLCSSRLELLKLSVECAEKQLGSIDYDIYIVVNTQNELFYRELIDYYHNNKPQKVKKIVRTESNGKPGKGHNSCIELFKESIYDYLVLVDGDDFLYPHALYRIDQLQQAQQFDLLTLFGNSQMNKIEKVEENEGDEHEYTVKMDYTFGEVRGITNISKDYNNIVATPNRTIAINQKVIKEYEKLYHEDMIMYDDYYTFLLIYNEFNKNNFEKSSPLNILLINDHYMYLYNKFNDGGVTKRAGINNDIERCEKLKEEMDINPLQCEKLKIIPYERLIKEDETEQTRCAKEFYKRMMEQTRYIKGAITNDPPSLPRIAFIDNGDWDYTTIQKKPIGGTQSAMLYLSTHISSNAIVMVFTNSDELKKTGIPQQVKENLYYSPLSLATLDTFNPDYVVCQGMIDDELYEYVNTNKKKLIIWTQHDINVTFIKKIYPQGVLKWNVHKYLFVSKWQRDRYIQKFHIPKSKCAVIQNGISDKIQLPLVLPSKKKELIYISSPYRGLLIAYPLFKAMKQYLPDITFKVFSCFNRDFNNDYNTKEFAPHTLETLESIMTNEYNRYYRSLYTQLIQQEGVEFYGSVPQDVLFEHMKTAMVLFYPNTYAETCCTSILECMAHRCSVVTSELGALPETCSGYARLFNPLIDVLDDNYSTDNAVINPIKVEEISKKYMEKLVENTIEVLTNYESVNNQRRLDEQEEYIKAKCTWKTKANEFMNIMKIE